MEEHEVLPMPETGEQTLTDLCCPRCGRPMEHGYLAGHWFPIRWTTNPKSITIFEGKPLQRMNFWCAPSLEAARCPVCKLGVFTFEL